MNKCGDALDLLKELPDNSVDCAVIDPPYYRIMITEWNGKKHEWDNQWDNFAHYLDWVSKWVLEIKRVLKENGSLYIFANDKLACYVRQTVEKVGYSLINEIIWVKNNNMTNKGWSSHRCYAPVTERILFFARAESEYEHGVDGLNANVFSALREYLINEKDKIGITADEVNTLVGTASMAGRHYFSRSQWCFPTKDHYERMQLTFNAFYRKLGTVEQIGKLSNGELIKMLANNYEILRKDYDVLRKDYEELRKDYDVLRRYFKPEANFTDVWISDITSSTDKQIHPTQKPLWLMSRIIKTSCPPSGVVLDPFMGSGTTGVACQIFNRKFIGFELDKTYFEIAEKRIREQKYMGKLFNFDSMFDSGLK